MEFPSELRHRFECLGLDIDVFYSSPIRKCFRIHQSIKDLDQFEPVPWSPEYAFFYGRENNETIKKKFMEGKVYIQDGASLIPPLALEVDSSQRVLDGCAAPGTKTLHLSYLMNGEGELYANESYRSRSFRLKGNLKRFDAGHVQVLNMNFHNLKKKFDYESFDRILLDPPCTGEGMIRKIKKVLQMWNIKRMKYLVKLQKKMIDTALFLLKPGGILVYSTCTLAPEENEGILHYALKKNKNILIEDFCLQGLRARPGIQQWQKEQYDDQVRNAWRIYPEDFSTNGFFVSKIRKK